MARPVGARRRGGRKVPPTTTTAPITTAAPATTGGPPAISGPLLQKATQRILDGILRGELAPITITAVVAMGVDPISAAQLYAYVKSHSYTPTPAQEVKGVVGGWVGDLLKGLLPILKVGAGGIGLLVSGLALVYVAGRNVPSKAAPVSRAVRTVTRVPGRGPERRIAAAKRTAARSDLARARVSTEHQRRPEGVVKIASRRVGRERLREEGALHEASVRRTPDRGATMAEGLGSPRRRAPKTHARA